MQISRNAMATRNAQANRRRAVTFLIYACGNVLLVAGAACIAGAACTAIPSLAIAGVFAVSVGTFLRSVDCFNARGFF